MFPKVFGIKIFEIFSQLERDWNSWDDKPRTVGEHIEVYRESLVKAREPEPDDEIEKIDLFAACVRRKLVS